MNEKSACMHAMAGCWAEIYRVQKACQKACASNAEGGDFSAKKRVLLEHAERHVWQGGESAQHTHRQCDTTHKKERMRHHDWTWDIELTKGDATELEEELVCGQNNIESEMMRTRRNEHPDFLNVCFNNKSHLYPHVWSLILRSKCIPDQCFLIRRMHLTRMSSSTTRDCTEISKSTFHPYWLVKAPDLPKDVVNEFSGECFAPFPRKLQSDKVINLRGATGTSTTTAPVLLLSLNRIHSSLARYDLGFINAFHYLSKFQFEVWFCVRMWAFVINQISIKC